MPVVANWKNQVTRRLRQLMCPVIQLAQPANRKP
jgi:hypothetical protein